MSCKTATSGRPGPCGCPVFAVLGLGDDAAFGACGLEKLQQFPLDGFVASHHAALVEYPVLAIGIAHECASFAQHHNPRGKVPGLQIALPEAIESASSSPGKVERGRAEPPHASRG